MKKFKFTINGNQYEVDILNIEENIAQLEVNGTPYEVQLDREIKATKTPKLMRTAAVPSTDSHPSVAKTSSPSVLCSANLRRWFPLVNGLRVVCIKRS